MPTSRYESYPCSEENISKEEIVGEARIIKTLGELALEAEEKED